MAPSCLDKKTVGRESPHDWPMRLVMDLATKWQEIQLPIHYGVDPMIERIGVENVHKQLCILKI